MTKTMFSNYQFSKYTEVLTKRNEWVPILSVDFLSERIDLMNGVSCTLPMVKDVRENNESKA